MAGDQGNQLRLKRRTNREGKHLATIGAAQTQGKKTALKPTHKPWIHKGAQRY